MMDNDEWYQLTGESINGESMSNNNTYGVINNDGIYTDTSMTLRGAKRYATLHGYTRVGLRYDNGYNITEMAIKYNNKWEIKNG
tara:strand:+ start:361 stop:612 length:252 start_codon:yes stop_codon:yes gene_type:complete